MPIDISIFDQIAEEQGWNNDSKVCVLLDFIANSDQYKSFEDYLLQRQEEENSG